jgi:transposase
MELVRERELTTPEAARGLSVSDQTVAGSDDTPTLVTDLDAEVSRLKRELTEAQIECTILKQTVAYFAKVQLSGTRL